MRFPIDFMRKTFWTENCVSFAEALFWKWLELWIDQLECGCAHLLKKQMTMPRIADYLVWSKKEIPCDLRPNKANEPKQDEDERSSSEIMQNARGPPTLYLLILRSPKFSLLCKGSDKSVLPSVFQTHHILATLGPYLQISYNISGRDNFHRLKICI